MVIWVLNHLMRYHTDFSDKMIMAIVLIVAPLLVWFMGCYLFINGVKLEIYENEVFNTILMEVEGGVYYISNLNLKI